MEQLITGVSPDHFLRLLPGVIRRHFVDNVNAPSFVALLIWIPGQDDFVRSTCDTTSQSVIDILVGEIGQYFRSIEVAGPISGSIVIKKRNEFMLPILHRRQRDR